MSKKYLLAGGALIIVLPIVALAWWLLSPLLGDQTIDEPLPFAVQAVVPPDMTREEVEDVMAGMAKLTRPVDEPMPEKMIGAEDSSGGSSPTTPPDKTTTGAKDSSGESSATATAEMPVDQAVPDQVKTDAKDSSAGPSGATAPSDSPTAAPIDGGTAVVLSRGSFQGADRFHQGSGEAIIYRGPDGSHLLRLENFQVTNGPDLHVILSPSPVPESRDDVHQPGYIDLGSLKGNVGNQNYEIPPDVDLNALSSVVIYCSPFHIVFSVAPLKKAG